MGKRATITWYEDDDLAIKFSDAPHVCVRYALPSSTPNELESIKKHPYINKTEFIVKILDHVNCSIYEFTIPKFYCWNGSDIPRFLWRVVSSQHEPQYLVASCLHDYMLENKALIDYDRRLSSKVFRACLLEAGVGKFKAKVMMEAVDLFQRTQNWKVK